MAKKMNEVRDYAKSRFDIAITAGKYIEEYKKVLSKSKRKGRV